MGEQIELTPSIAAAFYLDRARKALDAARVDPSGLLGNIPETIEGRAIAEIAALPEKGRRWLLLKAFGHRAVLDYELSDPRYSEDLNVLNRMVAGRAEAADLADVGDVALDVRANATACPECQGRRPLSCH